MSTKLNSVTLPLRENWLSVRFPLLKDMHEFISLLSAFFSYLGEIWCKKYAEHVRVSRKSPQGRLYFFIGVNEVYICACSVNPFIVLKVKHTECSAALFTA